MSAAYKEGTWVKIRKILLRPEERAPQVPEDTKQTPYVLHVHGMLEHDANLGDEVRVRTMTGRTLSGTLVQACPSYTHSFGDVVPELLPIGKEEEFGPWQKK